MKRQRAQDGLSGGAGGMGIGESDIVGDKQLFADGSELFTAFGATV